MSLPPGFLEELRTRITLSDVVGRKVTWDRAKSNPGRQDWWAPCPFHQEKTASFHVDDRKGYYYCFGCQAKGDAITFLREQENMGFMEAVETLAGEAGMTMLARDPRAAAQAESRKGLGDVMDACVKHYRLMLRGGGGAEALRYLRGRDLDDAALERFEIGFAPDARRGLAEAMASKGVPEDELVRTGMLIRPDDGGRPYDRFRGRIMFPIRDARGRCIAFGGRAMNPDARAKYLNSPETELFDKGRSLYNHGPAREAAGKAGRLIVAEGYMDVIALVRAGFAEAAAPLGTAVTPDQLRLMWKMTDEPVIALDGDAAGLRAAYRAADLALPLLEAGKSLRFCLMPAGKDPDDLIRDAGPEAMAEALQAALPLVEMIWRKAMEERDLTSPERRAGFDKDLRATLKRIEDPSVRGHYAQAFRERREALFGGAPARGAARGPAPRPWGGARRGGPGFGARSWGFAEAPAARPETRASLLVTQSEAAEFRIRESALLWGALHHPATAERHEDALRALTFLNADLSRLRDRLLDALPDCLDVGDPCGALRAALTEALGADPEPFLRTERLSLTAALGPGAPRGRVEVEFADLIDRCSVALAAREEGAAAVEEISLETADEIAARLDYISRRRDGAGSRGRDDGTDVDEGDDALSRTLRAFIEDQPWVRKARRKN